MGLEFKYDYGQTPLDENEKVGLKLLTISTQAELNEHEQRNIEMAVEWSLNKKFKQEQILSEAFIKKLHKKMFSDVWQWAGEFRKSEKNIGVSWINISIELRTLINDTKYWLTHKTFPPDEIAIRFKHRLVSIHCFPNGNGRHSRIMADIIIFSIFDYDLFTWNHSSSIEPGDNRKKYIDALKQGDCGDINSLIKFARG